MQKENFNNDLPEKVKCPLYKKTIRVDMCFDTIMVVDKKAPERIIEKKLSDTDKKICKNCKYYDC